MRLRRPQIIVAYLLGCGGAGSAPASPVCDGACQDGVAILALRETVKDVYNVTLQGNAVGPQDRTTPCPLGGTARVYGQASSNASQGTTMLSLTYVFQGCTFSQHTGEAGQTFDVTLSGTVTEDGTLAVQPSSTTAVLFQSSDLTMTGTVYDPPIPYAVSGCALSLMQTGSGVSGMWCGRFAGTML